MYNLILAYILRLGKFQIPKYRKQKQCLKKLSKNTTNLT